MVASWQRWAALGVLVTLVHTVLPHCWHVVPEGYVGFFYQFGRMLDEHTTADPGLHAVYPPPITHAINVYVMPQVDSVKSVQCGAKDGTSIVFPSIEVGNTLPRSKAHSVVKTYGEDYDQFLVFKQVEYIMNGICSTHTSHELAIERFNDLDDLLKAELESIQSELKTGLLIGFVRISKPILPAELAKAYQRQAAERALKKAKEEEYLRIQQENLNEQLKVEGVTQRELIKAKNLNAIALEKHLSRKEQKRIEHEILIEESKAKFEAQKKLAESNQLLLTPQYLALKRYESLLSNTKIMFGNDIPKQSFLNGLSLLNPDLTDSNKVMKSIKDDNNDDDNDDTPLNNETCVE